jgi:hypothetical protein
MVAIALQPKRFVAPIATFTFAIIVGGCMSAVGRKRRRRGEPGRVKLKLAEMLREKGLVVYAEDFWVQQGAYSHEIWDLARWGINGQAGTFNIQDEYGNWQNFQPDWPIGIHSWDTMTNCVRYGIEITYDRDDVYGSVQVHAKYPSN